MKNINLIIGEAACSIYFNHVLEAQRAAATFSAPPCSPECIESAIRTTLRPLVSAYKAREAQRQHNRKSRKKKSIRQ